MRSLSLFLLFLFLTSGSLSGQPSSGFSPGSEHAELKLLAIPMAAPGSDVITLQNTNEQKLLTGFHIELEEGWHTYWQNPGDSGIPARIDWNLPEGFEAGAIQWPYPQSFQEGHMITYGYKNESLLFQPVSISEDLDDGRYELSADVEFLVCKQACLPGFEKLRLEVELRDGRLLPAAESAHAAFDRFRSDLPQEVEAKGAYQQESQQLQLLFPESLGEQLREAFGISSASALDLHFYASAENVTEASAPQEFDFQENSLAADLRVSRYRNEPLSGEMEGVLVAKAGGQTQAFKLLFTPK
jgi:thiol:disulfide interchange protein DsbD